MLLMVHKLFFTWKSQKRCAFENQRASYFNHSTYSSKHSQSNRSIVVFILERVGWGHAAVTFFRCRWFQMQYVIHLNPGWQWRPIFNRGLIKTKAISQARHLRGKWKIFNDLSGNNSLWSRKPGWASRHRFLLQVLLCERNREGLPLNCD